MTPQQYTRLYLFIYLFFQALQFAHSPDSSVNKKKIKWKKGMHII